MIQIKTFLGLALTAEFHSVSSHTSLWQTMHLVLLFFSVSCANTEAAALLKCISWCNWLHWLVILLSYNLTNGSTRILRLSAGISSLAWGNSLIMDIDNFIKNFFLLSFGFSILKLYRTTSLIPFWSMIPYHDCSGLRLALLLTVYEWRNWSKESVPHFVEL